MFIFFPINTQGNIIPSDKIPKYIPNDPATKLESSNINKIIIFLTKNWISINPYFFFLIILLKSIRIEIKKKPKKIKKRNLFGKYMTPLNSIIKKEIK